MPWKELYALSHLLEEPSNFSLMQIDWESGVCATVFRFLGQFHYFNSVGQMDISRSFPFISPWIISLHIKLRHCTDRTELRHSTRTKLTPSHLCWSTILSTAKAHQTHERCGNRMCLPQIIATEWLRQWVRLSYLCAPPGPVTNVMDGIWFVWLKNFWERCFVGGYYTIGVFLVSLWIIVHWLLVHWICGFWWEKLGWWNRRWVTWCMKCKDVMSEHIIIFVFSDGSAVYCQERCARLWYLEETTTSEDNCRSSAWITWISLSKRLVIL